MHFLWQIQEIERLLMSVTGKFQFGYLEFFA